MKKYMIRCDIEGVSGVVSYEQADPSRPEFGFGKRMFMSDLLAVVAGLNEGGADGIVIYDEHFHGRNIDLDALPGNVSAICGKPPYRADWAGGLDDSFAGLILLGFHSMRGTGELLHHSYEPDIKAISLNGVAVGEIGVEAAIAGDWGVPLVLVTADSAGVREAQTLISGVRGVAVKNSLSAEGGECFSVAKTSAMLRDAAREIVKNPPAVKPWKVDSPELTVRFNPGPYADAFGSGDRVTITGSTVTACWAEYWRRKLATFEAMK